MKEELNKYKSLVRSLQREKTILENKLENNESSLSDSNDTINSLNEDFNIVKEQKAKILANNNKLKEEVDTLNSKNSKLTESLEVKNKEVENLNNQILELNKQLKESKEANTKLIKEKNSIKESYLTKRANENDMEPADLKKLLKENYSLDEVDNKINEALQTRNALNKLSYTTLDESIFSNAKIRNTEKVVKESKENENSSLNAMANIIKKKAK